MASEKITVQTKWQGVWGEKVRMPSGAEYQCSERGEMEVSEEDARELCSTSGWRRKPVTVTKAPLIQKISEVPNAEGGSDATYVRQPAPEAPKPEAPKSGKGKGKKQPLKAEEAPAEAPKPEAEEPAPEGEKAQDEEAPADEKPAE